LQVGWQVADAGTVPILVIQSLHARQVQGRAEKKSPKQKIGARGTCRTMPAMLRSFPQWNLRDFASFFSLTYLII
jgi:hypothetical protein